MWCVFSDPLFLVTQGLHIPCLYLPVQKSKKWEPPSICFVYGRSHNNGIAKMWGQTWLLPYAYSPTRFPSSLKFCPLTPIFLLVTNDSPNAATSICFKVLANHRNDHRFRNWEAIYVHKVLWRKIMKVAKS
jgi:hypothetical protein